MDYDIDCPNVLSSIIQFGNTTQSRGVCDSSLPAGASDFDNISDVLASEGAVVFMKPPAAVLCYRNRLFRVQLFGYFANANAHLRIPVSREAFFCFQCDFGSDREEGTGIVKVGAKFRFARTKGWLRYR